MADVLLARATVPVKVDLAGLQAGLADARTMLAQFDAANKSGAAALLAYTKAANDAAAAVTGEGVATDGAEKAKRRKKSTDDAAGKASQDATKASNDAAAAATREATATDGAEKAKRRKKTADDAATKASIDHAAAEETEAQRTARLSEMIDRSVAAYERQRNAAASAAAAQRQAGAGVAGSRATVAAQNAVMGLGAGGIIPGLEGAAAAGAAGAAAGAAEAVEKKAVAEAESGLKKVADNVAKLGTSAALSSGSIREMIVLAREAGRGDFTRMAGSATLLAQRMGAIEAIGGSTILTFGALAVATAVLGFAFVKGQLDAQHFENELRLTGNIAGETASTYEASAHRIADASDSTIGQAKAMQAALSASHKFTREEIEQLAESAVRLSRATGESADDIIADFARMAKEGPTKYADSINEKFPGMIDPKIRDHIALLERTGDVHGAMAELINSLNASIAKNTEDNVGFIVHAWRGAEAAVSGFANALMSLGRGSTNWEKIVGINKLIQNNMSGPSGLSADDPYIRNLIAQRDALVQTEAAAERAADAKSKDTQATIDGNKALEDLSTGKFAGLADRTKLFADAKADLARTVTAAARIHPGEDQVLSKLADKRTPVAVQLGRLNLDKGETLQISDEAIKNLRKQYEPDAIKAEKAGESAAKKAAREAEAAARKAAQDQKAFDAEVKRQNDAFLTANAALMVDHGARADVERQKLDQEKADYAKGLRDQGPGGTKRFSDEQIKQLELQEAKTIQLRKDLIDAQEEDKTRKDALDIAKAAASTDEELARLEKQLTDSTGKVSNAEKRILDLKYQIERATLDDVVASKLATKTERDIASARLKQLDGLRAAEDAVNKRQDQLDLRGVDKGLGGKFGRQSQKDDITDQMQKDLKAVQKGIEDQLITKQEGADREVAIRRKAALEIQDVDAAARETQLEGAQATADSLATIAEGLGGKQSAAYKAMFAVSKAFAIADSIVKIQQGMAEALSLPFPENIPAIAFVAAQAASIVSSIQAVAANFSEGGPVFGPGSGTSDSIPARLSNGEFVINAESTRHNRPLLEAINEHRGPAGDLIRAGNAGQLAQGGGRSPRIIINRYGDVDVAVKRSPSMDEIEFTVRRIVREDSPMAVASDLNNPNSRTSKAIRRTTDARPRRF